MNAAAVRDEAAKGRRYAWCVVGLLWMVCFLNYADRQAIYSVFSVLGHEFRLSDVQLGVLAGCFMWAYAAFGPLAGWTADRCRRPRWILGALCFWSVCTAATSLAPGYASLLVLRMLAGVGEAFYFPTAMSLLADYHGPATRSRAMAVHQSSVYLGTIAGGTASAYVAERAGWRLSFEGLGGCGLLLAVVLWVWLREAPRTPAETPRQGAPGAVWAELLALARNRAVVLLVGVFVGANFVAVVFLVWMPTFLQRKFGMDLGAAGFNSTAYVQVASVAGVLAGGFLADRLGRETAGARQWVQAAGLLGGVGFLFLTGSVLSVVALLVSMTGFGFFKGMYDANIWASLYDVLPAEQRGLATGVMNSLGWLGAGFAPIAFAVASRHLGPSACLSLTALVYLVLAGPVAWLAVSRGRQAVVVAG